MTSWLLLGYIVVGGLIVQSSDVSVQRYRASS